MKIMQFRILAMSRWIDSMMNFRSWNAVRANFSRDFKNRVTWNLKEITIMRMYIKVGFLKWAIVIAIKDKMSKLMMMISWTIKSTASIFLNFRICIDIHNITSRRHHFLTRVNRSWSWSLGPKEFSSYKPKSISSQASPSDMF